MSIELQLQMIRAGVRRLNHNWQGPPTTAEVYRKGEKEGIAVSKANGNRVKIR